MTVDVTDVSVRCPRGHSHTISLPADARIYDITEDEDNNEDERDGQVEIRCSRGPTKIFYVDFVIE